MNVNLLLSSLQLGGIVVVLTVIVVEQFLGRFAINTLADLVQPMMIFCLLEMIATTFIFYSQLWKRYRFEPETTNKMTLAIGIFAMFFAAIRFIGYAIDLPF